MTNWMYTDKKTRSNCAMKQRSTTMKYSNDYYYHLSSSLTSSIPASTARTTSCYGPAGVAGWSHHERRMWWFSDAGVAGAEVVSGESGGPMTLGLLGLKLL